MRAQLEAMWDFNMDLPKIPDLFQLFQAKTFVEMLGASFKIIRRQSAYRALFVFKQLLTISRERQLWAFEINDSQRSG